MLEICVMFQVHDKVTTPEATEQRAMVQNSLDMLKEVLNFPYKLISHLGI